MGEAEKKAHIAELANQNMLERAAYTAIDPIAQGKNIALMAREQVGLVGDVAQVGMGKLRVARASSKLDKMYAENFKKWGVPQEEINRYLDASSDEKFGIMREIKAQYRPKTTIKKPTPTPVEEDLSVGDDDAMGIDGPTSDNPEYDKWLKASSSARSQFRKEARKKFPKRRLSAKKMSDAAYAEWLKNNPKPEAWLDKDKDELRSSIRGKGLSDTKPITGSKPDVKPVKDQHEKAIPKPIDKEDTELKDTNKKQLSTQERMAEGIDKLNQYMGKVAGNTDGLKEATEKTGNNPINVEVQAPPTTATSSQPKTLEVKTVKPVIDINKTN